VVEHLVVHRALVEVREDRLWLRRHVRYLVVLSDMLKSLILRLPADLPVDNRWL
jgi:hypothetical protein